MLRMKTNWMLLTWPARMPLLILVTIITGGAALKDVAVVVPQAASVGDTVTLQCRFDTEGEPLYTLKWYKGAREFYRYIPKELPDTQIFPYQDLDVDLAKSNRNAIVLRNLQAEHSGKYRCEVSTDSPNFYTKMDSGYMYVVDVPKEPPVLNLEKDVYEVGYVLRGNCTSPSSYPPVNLTWYLNDRKLNESYSRQLYDPSSTETKRRPSTRVSGLELEIDGNTFQMGKARIKCTANLFHLYSADDDEVLEEERPRPRPSSVLGTRDSSGSRALEAMFLMKTGILLALIVR